jgi:putative transposase
MAKLLNVSRSGYYDWLGRPLSIRAEANQSLATKIKDAFYKGREVYGYRRVHAELKMQAEPCNRKRVAKLMQKHQLKAKTKKRFRVTTDSKHNQPIYENILAREFNPPVPNKFLAGDITYIWTEEGWLFLAVVLDLFSRKVVGWAMGARMTSDLVENALKMAINHRKPTGPILIHSDRGSQYASASYQALLKQFGLTCSMSRKGNCWDNSVSESFFRTLKTELTYHNRYLRREDAIKSVFEYIEVFYNRQRRHSTLGYLSPVDYEAKMAA